MAQRPAPPRHREALRCALDDRARSRCACGSCLAVSPCPHTCATAAADAVSLRVLDASRPGACSQVPLDSRSRGRQAAGGEARACPSWRPRALPALDERSRFRPTGLRASSSVAPATAPVVDAASRPALLLVVSATASVPSGREQRPGAEMPASSWKGAASRFRRPVSVAAQIRPTQQRAGAPSGAPGLLRCQEAGVSPCAPGRRLYEGGRVVNCGSGHEPRIDCVSDRRVAGCHPKGGPLGPSAAGA